MLKNLKNPSEVRETLLWLLSTSGTLAGIAIGLAGIINVRPGRGAETIADEILLLSSLGFLLNCYLVFFAMRSGSESTRSRLLGAIDVVFLAALTLEVFAGFVIVFELM